MNQIHEEQEVVKYGQSLEKAEKAVILMHGRGASPESLANLVRELPEAAYLLPRAANRTWYPRSFTEPREKNQPHLDSALNTVDKLVEEAAAAVGKENVYLGGFSQGACLSSTYAAENPERYGGVIVFSGGIIGEEIPDYNGDLEETPVYIGCAENDPHISAERVNETEEMLESLNADVKKQFFPDSSHTVREEELLNAAELIQK